MHFAPVDRAYKFLSAIFTLDSDFILETDHSGALRVVPIMILADLVDVSKFSGLFGNGIDYVSTISLLGGLLFPLGRFPTKGVINLGRGWDLVIKVIGIWR